MFYFDNDELKALLAEAYAADRLHHLALLVSLAYGLRVSECLGLRAEDIVNGHIRIRGLKNGTEQLQRLHRSEDPLFDLRPLATHAYAVSKLEDARLFPWTRQYSDRLIRGYCAGAGINPLKAHWHTLRHSTAMIVWSQSQSLGQVKQALRHRSWSAALIYLAEADLNKSVEAMARGLAAIAESGGA